MATRQRIRTSAPREVTVDGGDIIIIESGDRDVSFPETYYLTDALAGELGPVQTQDSFDLDELVAIEGGPQFGDSLDALDQAFLDADTQQFDSFFVGTEQRQVIIISNSLDSVGSDDAFDTSAVVTETVGTDDAGGPVDLDAQGEDSFSVLDAAPIQLLTTQEDEIFSIEGEVVIDPVLRDQLAASVLRGEAVIDADYYATDVATNSGFTNPANATGNTPGTQAVATIEQEGGLGGGSQSANITLELSYADLDFSPEPTVDVLLVEWAYETVEGNALQSGNAVDVDVETSLDEGGSWTLQQTITNTDTGGVVTGSAVIPMTYSQLQQFRIRFTGTITSGTVALVGGASQSFAVNTAFVQCELTQTL